MGTPAIDLSAGLVPTKPPNALQSGSPPIDLSAGLVSAPASTPSPQPPQSQGDYLSKAEDFISKGADVAVDFATGALKGAGQSANTVSKVINKIPLVGEHLAPKAGIQAAEQVETPTNIAQKVGVAGEGIAEFFLGDEALKSLSVAERLGLAAKVAKLAESHPAVAKLINIGLNSIRTGTIGAGQGAMHSESAGEAATTGAVAGGTGAGLETAAEGVKAIAPVVKDLAGERIPVRASQESKIASAAENVASSKTLQNFDVQQTQPAAKRAVGNVAAEVRNITAKRFGNDTKDFQQAVKELGNGKAFEDLSSANQSKVLARAQELKGSRNGLPTVADLGDAADSVRAQAKPVFEKLDNLTSDRDMKFGDWQKQERAAYRKGDYELANKAKAEQQKIIDEFEDQFGPDDLKNARAAWRQADALDRIDKGLNTKQVIGPTPVELRPQGTADPGYINGRAFSSQILKLANDGTLANAGLTKAHVQALQDLGTLLEKGNNIHKLNRLIASGSALFELGTVASNPGAALKAAKAGASALGASWALGKLLTNPDAASAVLKTLQATQKVAPAVSAQGSRSAFEATRDALSGQASQQ